MLKDFKSLIFYNRVKYIRALLTKIENFFYRLFHWCGLAGKLGIAFGRQMGLQGFNNSGNQNS